MNSLKTIYSRITTMEGSEKVLNDIGISVKDMATGDTRRVADIISDLAGQWNTLNHSQRQNIAVTLAGRNQLSRFLAMMNNFGMAQEATTTAMYSQGSAVRENAEYLKSFEARINTLKTSFTEFASAIGDAFLSSGLSVGIELLTKLASIGVSFVSTFGVLPALFGAVALALMKFGVFSATITTMKAGMTSLKAEVVATTGAFARLGVGARVAMSGIVAGARTAQVAVQSLWTSAVTAIGGFKGLIASTGILAGFLVLGYAIEKVVSAIDTARRKSEEYEKTQQKMIESFRASSDGMQGMLSRYDELIQKKGSNLELTSEESSELERLTAQFAEQLPVVVDYFNANGEAVLKSTEAIEEQIEVVKELSKVNAELTKFKLAENIEKEGKAIVEATKEWEEAKKTLEDMQKPTTQYDIRTGQTTEIAPNTEDILKQQMVVIEKQGQLQNALSGTTKALQNQVLAYVETNGQMSSFGDSQQKLIERFISYNDALLLSADSQREFEETANQMVESGYDIADVFTDAFQAMSEGLDDAQIEGLRAQLEGVASAIPDDFLHFDADYPMASVERIKNQMMALIDVSTDVKNQTGGTFDELAQQLIRAGIAPQQAKEAIGRLASEFENASLKADAMKQGVYATSDAVDTLTEKVLEATDPIANLFGYESGDIQALQSHIQTMEGYYEVFGTGAEKMEGFIRSQEMLEGVFNATGEEVRANLHNYTAMLGVMSNLEFSADKYGHTTSNLKELVAGLTEEQRLMWQAWVDSGGQADFVSGKMDEVAQSAGETAEALDQARLKNEQPFAVKVDDSELRGFLEGTVQGTLAKQQELRESMSQSSQAIGNVMREVNTSTQKMGEIKTSLGEVETSAGNMAKANENASTVTSTAFTNMSGAVTKNTATMNLAHQSQITKLGTLKTSALDANSAISTLNSTLAGINNSISIASQNLTAFQTKLSTANSSASTFRNNASTLTIPTGLTSYEGLSSNIQSAVEAFSATSEGIASSMASEGGGEGTSGVLKQSMPNLMPRFSALNDISIPTPVSNQTSTSQISTSQTSKVSTVYATATEKPKELAELYVVDLIDRKRVQIEGSLSRLQGRLALLTKNSIEYRKALVEIAMRQQDLLKLDEQELAKKQARNKQIEQELKQLGDKDKHTEAQRTEYNKLQQQYDDNLRSIEQLKNSIAETKIEINSLPSALSKDVIEGVIADTETAVEAIKGRIENIDFELAILEATDPDNMVAKTDLLATKVRELAREQSRYNVTVKEFEERIKEATKKHGADSESVKMLVEEMEKYKKSWQDTTLEIAKHEKEIRDMRGEIADNIVDAIKNQYRVTKENAEKAKNVEIDSAKKAHDAKMKLYDEESNKISELYDKRIKRIDEAESEKAYEEELAEKNTELAKLREKEITYSGDTSLEGRKKSDEIREEILVKEKELNKLINDNKIKTLKENLEKEKQIQLEAVEFKKELDGHMHDIAIADMEQERDAVSQKYDEIIENEKKWEKLRKDIMEGNFSNIHNLISGMDIDLQTLSNNTFNVLSRNFQTYSEDVKGFVLEINQMIRDINAVTGNAYGKTSDISPTEKVESSKKIPLSSITPLIQKAYAVEPLMSPTPDKEYLYKLIQDSNISQHRMLEIWRKAQEGIPLDLQTPEHMMFYTFFEDIIKYQRNNQLKRFNTGGYTGNNVPRNGGLAILDNKELVLNDRQTAHILDTAKLLDKIKYVLPNVSKGNINDKFATASEFTNTNNYNLNVNIDNLNGDKAGGELVVKEIMKGLKKLGR